MRENNHKLDIILGQNLLKLPEGHQMEKIHRQDKKLNYNMIKT